MTEQTTLSRRTATRGQRVTVTLKSGEAVTGTLAGWGAQMLSVRPEPGQGLMGWKREEWWVGAVERVTAA